MNKNLLVEIFVDVGEEEGYIATGYPVAPDRVITAHHALHPDGKQPVNIEIRWHHQKGKKRDWQSLKPEDCIVWENGKDFDVALLACKFPVKGNARLSNKRPVGKEDWESEGFPEAGQRDDDRREAVGLQGKTYHAAETQAWFELGVDNPVKKSSLWKGASGSPVFVNNEIIGIITSFQEPFGGKRFKATPTWKLLEIPEFRQKLCEEVDERAEREKRLEWARRKITALLAQCPELALKRLRDRLDLGSIEPWRITERLLEECSLQERLDLLNELRVEFQEQKEHNSLQCIRRLLNILLPAVFNHHLIALMRNQKNSFVHLAFDPQIATKTAAEIIMAGVDDRSTIFSPLQQEHELPKGKFNHYKELPPESGFRRDDKKSYILDFHKHMTDTFTPGRANQDSAALRVKQLATRSYDKQTQYYTFNMPGHPEDKARFTEVIEELQSKYPYLVFINLDPDEKQHSEEIEQMYCVADMLDVNENQENIP